MVARAPSSVSDRERVAAHVEGELTRLAYRFSPVGLLALLLTALMLGALLWAELDNWMLYAWFVVLFAISLTHYVIYKVFENTHPPRAELVRWEQRFIWVIAATGVALAVFALLFMPANPLSRLSAVALISVFVTAALGFLAPHPTAYRLLAFLVLIPLALALALDIHSGSIGFTPERRELILSGALLLMAGALPYVHGRVFRGLRESLVARFESLVMAERLAETSERAGFIDMRLADEVAERRRAELRQAMTQQKLALHLARTPLAVIEWDRDFRVTVWNPAAESVFGFAMEEALGKSAFELIIRPEEEALFRGLWAELSQKGGSSHTTLSCHTRGGRTIHCEWHNSSLLAPDGSVVSYASLIQDVTDRINTERTIHYMAHHDALTGLPNRRLMQDRLNQAIAQARRRRKFVAVLYLDLDRFKQVNDTLGHDTGDFVLKDIADRLRKLVRESDTVSREGGDEFIIILPDLDKPEYAQLVADKILHTLAQTMDIGGHEFALTTSIGISYYPNDATDVQNLLRHADAAMYQAKEGGRNAVRYFTSDLNFMLARRMEIEERLKKSLANNDFALRYQPQVDLATGKVTGVEALLRWMDPAHGEILPKDFLPFAEDLGLMIPLGEWVFQRVCEKLVAFAEEGHGDLRIAVNISPRQFVSKNLVTALKTSLADVSANPALIELEINEATLQRNMDQSMDTLRQLSALGVTIAIDHFGASYSPIRQLVRMPVATLKLDRNAIASITDDAAQSALADAIIALAGKLKLRVVAEGVETDAQRQTLVELGCHAYQGYLHSRPMQAEELRKLL